LEYFAAANYESGRALAFVFAFFKLMLCLVGNAACAVSRRNSANLCADCD